LGVGKTRFLNLCDSTELYWRHTSYTTNTSNWHPHSFNDWM